MRASGSQWIFYFPLIGILYFTRWGHRGPRPHSNFAPQAILFYAKGIWGFVSLLDIESIFQKIQFLWHNLSLQNTSWVIFSENPSNFIVCKICISGSFGPLCNSIHKKGLWQKFLFKHFLLQSFPTEPYLLTFSQQRNHSRNIFLYKFQIAWDWHLDAQ